MLGRSSSACSSAASIRRSTAGVSCGPQSCSSVAMLAVTMPLIQKRGYKKKKIDYRQKYGKVKKLPSKRVSMFIPTFIAYKQTRTPAERIWTMRLSKGDYIDEQGLIDLIKETQGLVECLDVVGLSIRRPDRQIYFDTVHSAAALAHLSQLYRPRMIAALGVSSKRQPYLNLDRQGSLAYRPREFANDSNRAEKGRIFLDFSDIHDSASVMLPTDEQGRLDADELIQSLNNNHGDDPAGLQNVMKLMRDDMRWRQNDYLYDLMEQVSDKVVKMDNLQICGSIQSIVDLDLHYTRRGLSCLFRMIGHLSDENHAHSFTMNIRNLHSLTYSLSRIFSHSSGRDVLASIRQYVDRQPTTKDMIDVDGFAKQTYSSMDPTSTRSITEMTLLPLSMSISDQSLIHQDSAHPPQCSHTMYDRMKSIQNLIENVVIERLHWMTQPTTMYAADLNSEDYNNDIRFVNNAVNSHVGRFGGGTNSFRGRVLVGESPLFLSEITGDLWKCCLWDRAKLGRKLAKSLIIRLSMDELCNSATRDEMCNILIKCAMMLDDDSNTVSNNNNSNNNPEWAVTEKRQKMADHSLSEIEKTAVLRAIRKIDDSVLSVKLKKNELSPILAAQLARSLSTLVTRLCGISIDRCSLSWFENGDASMPKLVAALVDSNALIPQSQKVESQDSLFIIGEFLSHTRDILLDLDNHEYETVQNAIIMRDSLFQHSLDILNNKINVLDQSLSIKDIREFARIFRLRHCQSQMKNNKKSKSKSKDDFLMEQKVIELLMDYVVSPSQQNDEDGSLSSMMMMFPLDTILDLMECFMDSESGSVTNWTMMNGLIGKLEDYCMYYMIETDNLRFNPEWMGPLNRRNQGLYRMFDVLSKVISDHYQSKNGLTDELEGMQQLSKIQHELWEDQLRDEQMRLAEEEFERMQTTMMRGGRTYRLTRYGRPYRRMRDVRRDARGGGSPTSSETGRPSLDLDQMVPVQPFVSSSSLSSDGTITNPSGGLANGIKNNGDSDGSNITEEACSLLSNEMVLMLKHEMERDIGLNHLDDLNRSEIAAISRLSLLLGDSLKSGFISRNLYKLYRLEKVSLCEDTMSVHNSRIVERVIQNRSKIVDSLFQSKGKVTKMEYKKLNDSIFHNPDFAHKTLLCGDVISVGGGRTQPLSEGGKSLFDNCVTLQEKKDLIWRLCGVAKGYGVTDTSSLPQTPLFQCLDKIIEQD